MTTTPQILGNRYEIGELLGRGGMAQVHLGRDTRLGRTVAVKLLRSDLTQDPLFQARFKREAQSSAGLNHPAIVAVYDTGEETITDAHGRASTLPFIVMEYVQGHTLREMVTEGQTLDVETALRVTSGVLSALEYSHQAGIVHRDIKPANVMVTQNGDVKVMDFGIARAMSDATNGMTQTQAVIGTAQYLSPEQARGETVDTRSDLYSAGCMLFELLTGRPPFVADSPVAVAYQHVREMPQPPSSFNPAVPEVVDRIVLHALVKERDDRYQTAGDFRTDIRAALAGHGVMAPAAQPGYPAGVAPAGYNASGPTEFYTGAMPGQGPGGYYPAGATGTMTGFGGYPAEDKTQRNTLVAIVAAAAVAAILMLVILRGGGNDPGEETPTAAPTATEEAPAPAEEITIPDVTGDSLEDARSELEDLGVKVETEYVDSEENDGKVMKQSIPGNTSIDKNDIGTSTIVLTVGKKPEIQEVAVPALAGMTQDEAIAALRSAGLNFSGWKQTDPEANPLPEDAVADTVILSSPPQGQQIPAGESVTLYYATQAQIDAAAGGGTGDPDPAQVAVPDLVGSTFAEASAALTGANLVVGDCSYILHADTALDGLVANSNPAAATMVDEGASVNFSIHTKDPTKLTTPCA